MSDGDLREIKESLHRIHSRIDTLAENVAATNARCPLHVAAVAEHDEALNAEATGVRPRLLKLEVAVGLMTWGLRAAWGVLVSLALMVAWFFFGGK